MNCRSDGQWRIRGKLERKGKIWFVVAAVLLVFLVSRVSSYEFEKSAVEGAYEATVSFEIQKLAQELARQQKAALNSALEIQINAEPAVDAGSGRCSLMLGNPEKNRQNLRVTLTLDEDGEILYQSPVLKPGERIAYVVLSRIPKPGEYPATAEFAALDADTGEAVGAVDAGVVLTVR